MDVTWISLRASAFAPAALPRGAKTRYAPYRMSTTTTLAAALAPAMSGRLGVVGASLGDSLMTGTMSMWERRRSSMSKTSYGQPCKDKMPHSQSLTHAHSRAAVAAAVTKLDPRQQPKGQEGGRGVMGEA